jgi:hypothetical protein
LQLTLVYSINIDIVYIKILIMNRKTLLTVTVTALITFTLTMLVKIPITSILADQTSSTPPDSGSTSRISDTYDSLTTLGYGSDTAGAWGDWGMWNRIRSAGEWTPSGDATTNQVLSGSTFYSDSRDLLTGTLSLTGDATEADVASGKTFYNNSTTQLTGTAQLAMDYSLQQYNEYDDYEGPGGNGELVNDYTGDEATWTNTSTNVWQDERTGLYWSNNLGNYSNIFPDQDHSTCDFFLSTPRGTYDGSDGDCGNAINTCGNLSLDADGDGTPETDWYLPTQKELQQAYLDGMYNQAGGSFTTTSMFWSSSEVSDNPTTAWRVGLHYGSTYTASKTRENAVRCVSRD